MSKARYEIHVPNQHRKINLAAHQYLTGGPVRGIHSATVQFGHPHDSLVVMGEESPELDSHIKQTASFIGDVANEPFINVMKQGKTNAHWPIANRNYQPAPVQAPVALDNRPAIQPLTRPMAPATAQPPADGTFNVVGQ